MFKKLLTFLLLLLPIHASYASDLYSPYDGVEFEYRFLDSKNYDVNRIKLEGTHSLAPHVFSYNFSHIFGDQSLTSIGASYSFRGGSHWIGGGIYSASDKPFTQLNLIDFDIFYAFRMFQNTVHYTVNRENDRIPHYSRLYLGIDYSTERILLDGYPLPIIRYEYDGPRLYMILGFPLTYLKISTARYQSLELKYLPVKNLLLSYNFGFNANNVLSLQFEMEHHKYRMSGEPKDLYFNSQEKYYTEMTWVRLKYGLRLADAALISPYAALLVDGNRYYGKNFDVKHKNKIDFGYALGLNFLINF